MLCQGIPASPGCLHTESAFQGLPHVKEILVGLTTTATTYSIAACWLEPLACMQSREFRAVIKGAKHFLSWPVPVSRPPQRQSCPSHIPLLPLAEGQPLHSFGLCVSEGLSGGRRSGRGCSCECLHRFLPQSRWRRRWR